MTGETYKEMPKCPGRPRIRMVGYSPKLDMVQTIWIAVPREKSGWCFTRELSQWLFGEKENGLILPP